MTAQQVVDELTEGRFRDFLSNAADRVKDLTGIGQDSFGLGKNTEKGWKPKYDGKRVGTAPAAKRIIKRQEPPGEKTWDIG